MSEVPASKLPQHTPGDQRRTAVVHPAAAADLSVHVIPDLQGTIVARELFWHNVVREMLTSLSVLQLQGIKPELFDGRISVLTKGGERIPIGGVFPLFACSIPGVGQAHEASIAVECTVFRIQTPDGEVLTLPVHEIRALASLTDELIKQLEQASMSRTRPENSAPGPFGFAAFVPQPGTVQVVQGEEGAAPDPGE